MRAHTSTHMHTHAHVSFVLDIHQYKQENKGKEEDINTKLRMK